MKVVFPKTGRYVVAVSGGVDSMVLLDILSRRPELQLTVAHVDHGIRNDSGEDRKLVESAAATLDVPFVCFEAKLGSNTSEAKAREVRYKFLNQTKSDRNADGIITAHHQDDLIETAIVNMLRGTGRKGLTSLASSPELVRPLLSIPKKELQDYAINQNLDWREDSTNSDEKYLRNYIRLNYVKHLSSQQRKQLLEIIESMQQTNEDLDTLLVKYLQSQSVNNVLDRDSFNHLTHSAAREVMAAWLRSRGIRDFDSKTIERLVVAAKTAHAGKIFPVISGSKMLVKTDHLALEVPERY